MPVIDSRYDSPKFMHNGHFQTLYPYFFRKVDDVPFQRVRIATRDKDFLDLDYTDVGSDELVIISHGLEGSSSTGYVKGMSKFFANTQKMDVVSWNFRSCSGELNRYPQFYHGASIEDLDDVVEFCKKRKPYKKINFIGFSLGGNLTSYYLAKIGKKVHPEVNNAVVFSSPIDLEGSIHKLYSTKIGRFYSESFLVTMRKKVLQKSKIMDLKGIDLKKIKKAKDFISFDDLYTAPTCGFKNARDYYHTASACNLVKEIESPILFVQAKDDPFLTKECFPIREAWRSDHIHLEMTPTGGHVGFMNLGNAIEFWSEVRAAEFISGQLAIERLREAS